MRRAAFSTTSEYLEGQTLREWMTDHPRAALPQVRDIAAQLATGLRAFHRLEMAHRDLKPENVLIQANGQLKIIDFGSVRIAGMEEAHAPVGGRHPMGTRSYSAPECFMDHPGDARADQFSLAVIVYELITGRLPYGDGAVTRFGKPKPYPSAAQYAPGLPYWVDESLRKALSWRPEDRYGDVSEFVHDLSQPNPAFHGQRTLVAMIERNPVAFWRPLALVLLVLCIVLTMLLLR